MVRYFTPRSKRFSNIKEINKNEIYRYGTCLVLDENLMVGVVFGVFWGIISGTVRLGSAMPQMNGNNNWQLCIEFAQSKAKL